MPSDHESTGTTQCLLFRGISTILVKCFIHVDQFSNDIRNFTYRGNICTRFIRMYIILRVCFYLIRTYIHAIAQLRG